MSKRTVKDIEAQIAALEEEKQKLQQQTVLEKFNPLLEILSTTTLSVTQIKKLIKDAENQKTISDKKTHVDSEKISRNRYSQEKVCTECTKKFIAKSPRQTICPECKAKKDSK